MQWIIKLNSALLLTVFPAKPPTPPSAAQEATQAPVESSPFFHSIKRLALNRNYVLLLISYGMNVGVFYAISTLLNQVKIKHPFISWSRANHKFTRKANAFIALVSVAATVGWKIASYKLIGTINSTSAPYAHFWIDVGHAHEPSRRY